MYSRYDTKETARGLETQETRLYLTMSLCYKCSSHVSDRALQPNGGSAYNHTTTPKVSVELPPHPPASYTR